MSCTGQAFVLADMIDYSFQAALEVRRTRSSEPFAIDVGGVGGYLMLIELQQSCIPGLLHGCVLA